MRGFSLLFALIALVVLVQFLIYIIVGRPVDPLIAGVLLVSFLACAASSVYLLKPFEDGEALKRRRRERARRREADKEGPSERDDGEPGS